jgi:hypothetical protein
VEHGEEAPAVQLAKCRAGLKCGGIDGGFGLLLMRCSWTGCGAINATQSLRAGPARTPCFKVLFIPGLGRGFGPFPFSFPTMQGAPLRSAVACLPLER